MAKQINIESAVQSILVDYEKDVVGVVQAVVPKLAQEARRKLKADSPRRTGRYSKAWSYQNDKSRIGIKAVVFNKAPTYRLTHLLEYGHAKRGGGRTAPQPHIAKVDQWVQREGVAILSSALEAVK